MSMVAGDGNMEHERCNVCDAVHMDGAVCHMPEPGDFTARLRVYINGGDDLMLFDLHDGTGRSITTFSTTS